jgi:hypothetical protein
LLVALGHTAVEHGHRVRYFTAADLVEALYRGLADNSVGRIIDQTLRHDLIIIDEIGFAPLDDTAAQLLFRLVAAAYERRSLAISSHWPLLLRRISTSGSSWTRTIAASNADTTSARHSGTGKAGRTATTPMSDHRGSHGS